MGKKTTVYCDVCGTEEGVETVTLTVGNRVLEIDLCPKDLAAFTEKTREVGRKRGRPRKTVATAAKK